jgi:crotonobetaine/carnitine-CoA ligase
LTYGEVNEKANRMANTFIKRFGVQKGDTIAVMLPNCADYVVVQFGVAKTGAIQVPINIQAKGDLLAHFLNNSGAKVVLTDRQFLPLLHTVQHQIDQVEKVILYPRKSADEKGMLSKAREFISYEELFVGEVSPPQRVVNRTDPVDIFYTSGTTGVSKGVVLSHNHHYHFGAIIAEWARLGPGDVFYICLPFYHGVTQYMSVMPAILGEGSIAVTDRFSASRYWDEIRSYEATVTWAVYTMPAVLLKQPERGDDSDNPLRVFCTIGIAPDLLESFEKRFGAKVLDMYGSTEQEAIAFTPYDEKRYGAVGPINRKHFDIRIVDENDEEVPPGSIGEIVSRPKEPYIQMMEYYKMPIETLKTFRNLWLHSGDLGYIKDDWLYFVGREKDSIRRRGENISAYEIEQIILSYPDIKECAAIPISTELGEDEIKVVIVMKEGRKLVPQDLLAFCQDKMSKYMVPRYIETKQSLPKTSTEKVEKVKLKEEGITPETWDREKENYIKNLV